MGAARRGVAGLDLGSGRSLVGQHPGLLAAPVTFLQTHLRSHRTALRAHSSSLVMSTDISTGRSQAGWAVPQQRLSFSLLEQEMKVKRISGQTPSRARQTEPLPPPRVLPSFCPKFPTGGWLHLLFWVLAFQPLRGWLPAPPLPPNQL